MSTESFMLQAIEIARKGSAEDHQPRPKVGAVLVRDGAVLGVAYRGELGLGEHGEFTLLQRKLVDENLRGTTVYTTLEPCTTRNPPKRPCVEWIIDRGIELVVIGMLDPNPQVYERGVLYLRNAGITVDFFPAALKEMIRADNEAFIAQFRASPDLRGTVSFNFLHNNGKYTLGHGNLTFVTRWSNAGSQAIHVYTDGTRLRGLGLVRSATSFAQIGDASAYDMSSRVQTPREGQFVVFHNAQGYFAAARILDVKATSHGDPFDAVTLEYRINPDGGPQFVA